MRVVILTEAGKGIGLGHLSRCCAIADAFETKGIIPEFIVNADTPACGLLKKKRYTILDWLDKQDKLTKLIQNADIAIVDSYKAGLNIYKKISKEAKLSLYLDDNNRLNYPGGIILNGSIYAEKLNYPKDKEKSYLLGPKFLPLREEFWRVPSRKIKSKIKKILITFGGSDSKNMTINILRFLNKEYPELVKNVIVGSGFKNIDKIKQIKDKKTNLVYFPDAGRVKKLMLDCDIAVSAGGQTLYELARVGVPALSLAAAENQLNNLRGLERAGYGEYLGCWREMALLSSLNKGFKKFVLRKERIKQYKAARGLIDGMGARRIVDELISKAKHSNSANDKESKISLRKAKETDCYDLWVWRNHPIVRKWCFNSGRIGYRAHKKWFAEKIKGNYSNFYIMENSSGEKIGQVRFEIEKNKIAYVNTNLNPRFLRMGFGNLILRRGTKLFALKHPQVDEVRALIKDENIISKKAFHNAGYKFSHNTIKGDERVAIFKLEV